MSIARRHRWSRPPTALGAALLLLLCVGCRRDMQDQPKYKPLQASSFFADGRAARPIPPGTVAMDELNNEDAYHTGEQDGAFLDRLPIEVNLQALERGHERYDIFCSVCHGRIGDGNGMIKQRGLKWPANLHSERLRNAPPGYLYQVIRNGYGAMQGYAAQVPAADRWDIVAYVYALQLSENATLNDVPADARKKLGEAQR